jgi:hypothetical protein
MNNMSKDAKDARNEYMRKWRARNKDKVREYNQRYWERKAQEMAVAEPED